MTEYEDAQTVKIDSQAIIDLANEYIADIKRSRCDANEQVEAL